MKRFHVHVAVPDLKRGIRFYSTMFGASPTVEKPDYAKWMLEDPRVNFAISQRGAGAGINHLGLQVDDAAELEELHGRLQAAATGVRAEKNAACCLREIGQVLGHRSRGRRLGIVPHAGDGAVLQRRGRVGIEAGLLRAFRGCAIPAGGVLRLKPIRRRASA